MTNPARSAIGDVKSQVTDIFAPDDPTIKVPSYTLRIWKPEDLNFNTGNFNKSIYAQLDELRRKSYRNKSITEIMRDNVSIQNVRANLGYLVYGQSQKETISRIDVEFNIEDSRTQINKCSTVRIYNINQERIKLLIAGNLVEINAGYYSTGSTDREGNKIENPRVFFGYIANQEVMFEGDDFTVQLTLVPYVHGVCSTWTNNVFKDFRMVISDTDYGDPNTFKTISAALEKLVNKFLNENDNFTKFGFQLKVNTEELESIPAYVEAQANVKSGSEIEFVIPPKTIKYSIIDVIDSFLHQTILTEVKKADWNIVWWFDGDTIRFPQGKSVLYSKNEPTEKDVKKKLALGKNVTKVNGSQSISTKPEFYDNRDDGRRTLFNVELTGIRILVLMCIGLPDIKLGDIVQLQSNTVSDAIDQQYEQMRKAGATVSIDTSLAGMGTNDKEKWVVDAYEHIFDSTQSFQTRLRIIPAIVSELVNFRPSDPSERYRMGMMQDMYSLAERLGGSFTSYGMPYDENSVRRYYGLPVNVDPRSEPERSDEDVVDESDYSSGEMNSEATKNNSLFYNFFVIEEGRGKSEIWKHSATRSLLALARQGPNKIVDSSPKWKSITGALDGSNPNLNNISKEEKFVKHDAIITSPWAMMYQTPLESGDRWVAAGMWLPKYKPFNTDGRVNWNPPGSGNAAGQGDKRTVKTDYSQINQRHSVHTIGNRRFLGMQDWNHSTTINKGMKCYYTDYMIRTPARSVLLMPTVNQMQEIPEDGANTFAYDSKMKETSFDSGTITMIGKSVHIESNPLIKRNVGGNFSPHVYRPDIKALHINKSERTKSAFRQASSNRQPSNVVDTTDAQDDRWARTDSNNIRPYDASPIRFMINTSDDYGILNTSFFSWYKYIIPQSQTGTKEKASNYVYRSPVSEWILDNDRNKDIDNMTRMSMITGDDIDYAGWKSKDPKKNKPLWKRFVNPRTHHIVREINSTAFDTIDEIAKGITEDDPTGDQNHTKAGISVSTTWDGNRLNPWYRKKDRGTIRDKIDYQVVDGLWNTSLVQQQFRRDGTGPDDNHSTVVIGNFVRADAPRINDVVNDSTLKFAAPAVSTGNYQYLSMTSGMDASLAVTGKTSQILMENKFGADTRYTFKSTIDDNATTNSHTFVNTYDGTNGHRMLSFTKTTPNDNVFRLDMRTIAGNGDDAYIEYTRDPDTLTIQFDTNTSIVMVAGKISINQNAAIELNTDVKITGKLEVTDKGKFTNGIVQTPSIDTAGTF